MIYIYMGENHKIITQKEKQPENRAIYVISNLLMTNIKRLA
ncbi:hypothetical protein [Kordia algicida]|nr:hypothetical protein [Kordia algicida]